MSASGSLDRNRVFSREELRVAGLRSVDAFDAALAAGDREGARGFVRRLRREVLSMRVNYDGWEASLLDWIRRCDGDDVVAEALDSILASGGSLPAIPEGASEEIDFGERWCEVARRIDESLSRDASAERESKTGDEEATRMAHGLHAEALRYHDRGMARVSALLSWLGRRYGTDRLEEAYVEAMSADLLGDAGFRERAEALMHFTRVHLQPFDLEEDDEKLTFLCSVCPSGGRLLREGHADRSGGGLFVEGPSWLT